MAPHLRTGATAVAAIVAAAAVTGCTSANHDAHAAAATGRPTATSSATQKAPSSGGPASPDPHAPSVAKPPNLGEENVPTLVSAASLTADTDFPLAGGIQAGMTLAVAVNCRGEGTLKVTVVPTGLSFPLNCTAKQTTPTVNEVRFASTSASAHIQFKQTGLSRTTWSFAAGWDAHPAQIDQG